MARVAMWRRTDEGRRRRWDYGGKRM